MQSETGHPNEKTVDSLLHEIEELRRRLHEAEETLHAIRTGTVDALAIQGADGTEMYTLKTADHTYRVLIEEMNEGAVILSRDGQILYCNTAFGKMVSIDCDAAIGMPFLKYVAPAKQADFKKELESAASSGSRTELMLLKKSGRLTSAEVSIKSVNIDGTDAIYLVVSDISERKKAETKLVDKNLELEKSNSDLEQFAYVASHDLQEPLRMVSSYTTLLLKRIDTSDPEIKEFADFIRDGAIRMQRMLKDLLAYSRVGRVDVFFEEVDLNDILQEELHNMGAKIAEAKAEIEFDPLPVVRGVRSLLGQVFQNLLSNAIKFRHKERAPVIRISAENTGREWLFRVEDNGIGIKPGYSERVFIIFQRLHTQAEYPGTGIGLSLVKKAIEFHDGKIWIEQKKGDGTMICFTLPA
jgi:PAS domain S-box-containing protein